MGQQLTEVVIHLTETLDEPACMALNRSCAPETAWCRPRTVWPQSLDDRQL